MFRAQGLGSIALNLKTNVLGLGGIVVPYITPCINPFKEFRL